MNHVQKERQKLYGDIDGASFTGWRNFFDTIDPNGKGRCKGRSQVSKTP